MKDLGPLDAFPEGRVVLRKDGEGCRYACVREGDRVHAVDDQCPHQGYPLSQGSVNGGVLTCEWHNWKFELATGGCTFGGEPVRRYPTRVEAGRVYVDRRLDRGAEARRLIASLREALVRDDASRALREGLRLGELGIGPPVPMGGLGRMALAFELLALDGAERAEYGFDHGLALLADLASWAERGLVGAEEAFVHAARAIAEPSKNLGPRAKRVQSGARDPRATLARISDVDPSEPPRVAAALLAERREEAEAIARAITETRGPDGTCAALLPFVSRHILDYGHGAIFLAKALELARRFPAASVELAAATTTMLAWATADTALPPFAATRKALAELHAVKPGRGEGIANRADYEARVLTGEHEALAATLAELRAGTAPAVLLRATAHAAAARVFRFDPAWETSLTADVSILDVTHAVTFTEAALVLATAEGARDDHAARLAVLAAGFLGKLRRGDAAEPADGLEGPRATVAEGTLLDAANARDLGRALAIARSFDPTARRAAYRELAPFVAFDAAVRPIFYAHTVKMTEALRRLDEADIEADGLYLDALLAYVVPRRPENRTRRIAAIARKFVEDGRPPEALY
jgi:nitrite reductase/ring-hydroxylating ferredoxin subunit